MDSESVTYGLDQFPLAWQAGYLPGSPSLHSRDLRPCPAAQDGAGAVEHSANPALDLLHALISAGC